MNKLQNFELVYLFDCEIADNLLIHERRSAVKTSRISGSLKSELTSACCRKHCAKDTDEDAANNVFDALTDC